MSIFLAPLKTKLKVVSVDSDLSLKKLLNSLNLKKDSEIEILKKLNNQLIIKIDSSRLALELPKNFNIEVKISL